jgi:hypothetical protein
MSDPDDLLFAALNECSEHIKITIAMLMKRTMEESLTPAELLERVGLTPEDLMAVHQAARVFDLAQDGKSIDEDMPDPVREVLQEAMESRIFTGELVALLTGIYYAARLFREADDADEERPDFQSGRNGRVVHRSAQSRPRHGGRGGRRR